MIVGFCALLCDCASPRSHAIVRSCALILLTPADRGRSLRSGIGPGHFRFKLASGPVTSDWHRVHTGRLQIDIGSAHLRLTS
eukprot:195617-Rhodomonas_salina.1